MAAAGIQTELDGIHLGAHAPAAGSGAASGAAPDVSLVEGEAAAGGPALDAAPPAAVSEESTCGPAGRDIRPGNVAELPTPPARVTLSRPCSTPGACGRQLAHAGHVA